MEKSLFHKWKFSLLLFTTFTYLLLLPASEAQTNSSSSVQRRSIDSRRKEKDILDKILSSDKYDSNIRPGPLPNSTTSETLVKVNILLRSVSRIDDFSMEYSVQILLRQEWYDDRLAYGQRPGARFASSIQEPPYLTITDSSKVWIPDLFFSNEKDGRLHKIINPNQYVRIFKDGTVLFSIRLSLVLGCPMDLTFFPMDRQKCQIMMASYGLTTEDLVFQWKGKSEDAIQIPSLSLPRFHLERFETYRVDRTTITGTYSTLKADFILKRNFSFYMTQLYLPCIMLVIVSQISFFLDENAAPARTALGITTLLTMATQSGSINRSLPPVSYTKAIDIWNNACLVFVFAALVEYAFVNYYVRYDKRMKKQWQEAHGPGTEPPPEKKYGWLSQRFQSRSKRIDVCCRVIFPILFVIFNIFYWTICLTADDGVSRDDK